LNNAAFLLRALGRLIEGVEPMRASLEMRIDIEDWRQAAIVASNLSELELTLGNVALAVGDAEQSVTYADRSADPFERMTERTTHADSLHHAGRRSAAATRFREAEQMQAEHQPDYPLLYSTSGFRYCDLLLAAPERAAWQVMQNSEFRIQKSELVQECRAISQRAAQTLNWEERMPSAPLLDFALHHVTLGRAALYEGILERGAAFTPLQRSINPSALDDDERRSDLQVALQTAHHELDAAVAGLRRAGTTHWIPAGLLTRAWLRFLTGAQTGPGSAQEDLDEAWEIAERGTMRLFMADTHLYRARLFHAVKQYPWAKDDDGNERGPKDDLAAARKLIEECGYWRRKEELEDAEAAAKNW
jgi:hypothetical protein